MILTTHQGMDDGKDRQQSIRLAMKCSLIKDRLPFKLLYLKVSYPNMFQVTE